MPDLTQLQTRKLSSALARGWSARPVCLSLYRCASGSMVVMMARAGCHFKPCRWYERMTSKYSTRWPDPVSYRDQYPASIEYLHASRWYRHDFGVRKPLTPPPNRLVSQSTTATGIRTSAFPPVRSVCSHYDSSPVNNTDAANKGAGETDRDRERE